MDRCVASAAGGTSHRLYPGWATDRFRSRKDKAAMSRAPSMHFAFLGVLRAAEMCKQKGREQ
jgi:hypothetical protein